MTALELAKYIVAADEIAEGRYDYGDAIRALRALILAYENARTGIETLRERIAKLEESRTTTLTFHVNSAIDIDAATQAIKRALDAPNAGLPVGAPVEAIPTWRAQPSVTYPTTPQDSYHAVYSEWIDTHGRHMRTQ